MVNKNLSLKLEIKNKKLFLQYTAAGMLIVSIIVFFVWQFLSAAALKQAVEQKKAELKEAKAASKHLKKLEKEVLVLEDKEKAINKEAPRNEKNPFGLIKSLTILAQELGLENTAFEMKKVITPDGTAFEQGQIAAVSEEGLISQEASPAFNQNEGYAAPIPSGLIPINFEMRFEGSYLQLLKLLEKLFALERIITVEQIRIERKKELIPSQKISLFLTAYSFPKE